MPSKDFGIEQDSVRGEIKENAEQEKLEIWMTRNWESMGHTSNYEAASQS